MREPNRYRKWVVLIQILVIPLWIEGILGARDEVSHRGWGELFHEVLSAVAVCVPLGLLGWWIDKRVPRRLLNPVEQDRQSLEGLARGLQICTSVFIGPLIFWAILESAQGKPDAAGLWWMSMFLVILFFSTKLARHYLGGGPRR